MKSYKSTIKRWAFVAVLPLLLAACNGATGTGSSSTDSSTETEASTAFPSSLAIASPLNYSVSSSSSVSNLRMATSGSGTATSAYSSASATLSAILSSGSSSVCTFDAEDFLAIATDADCFGPNISYEDHPDSSSTGAGQLPSGDLGLWTETDATSGDACAAAQLNKRMEAMEAKGNAAIQALATMICAANTAGTSLPATTSSSTTNLTTEMTALGLSSLSFINAEVSYDVTAGAYSYVLAMDYTDGSSTTHRIGVNMTHIPTSASVFEGTISWLADDTFSGGNCGSSNVTHNGSIQYESVSSTEVNYEVRNGMFCEHGSDGRDSNYLVDPSDKLTSTNTTGWGNSFSIFTVNFDPTTMDGDFAYTWQAGPQDDNSRSFNVNISNSGVDGLAFFGYGDDIDSTDGSIDGFICNWAGPGSNHTIIEYAQYQQVELDITTGAINPVSSNIGYAPTVSCEYDGLSTFVYDTDIDGDLSDEDPTLAVANDLLAGSDIDLDGVDTIEEVITDYGFTTPSM